MKALFVVVTLLATSLVLFVFLNRGEPQAPTAPGGSDIANTTRSEDPADVDLAPISGAGDVDLAGGRTVAPTVSAGDADASSQPVPGDEPVTQTVQVLVEASPWLGGSSHKGSVRWSSGEAYAERYAFTLSPEGVGTVSLPAVPEKATEFQDLNVAGLALRLDELEIPAQEGSPTIYRLRASVQDGASLVWAQSATQRPPLNVVLGGDTDPTSRGPSNAMLEDVGAELRTGLELPLVLPRLIGDGPAWVGASGFSWRAFTVTPSATRIEVALTAGASMRVLHDPPTGEDKNFLFMTSFPVGATDSRSFQGAAPVEVTERSAGTYEVWIAARNNDEAPPLSRIARLDLVAGEITTVDLTEAHARDHLGGLRVHAIGSPETMSLAADDFEPMMSRKTGKDPDRPWEHFGRLQERPAESKTGGLREERVFEALGLEPYLHRVTINPFGARVTQAITPGEVQDVYIDLDDMGWVELVFPSDSPPDNRYVYLLVAAPDPDAGAFVSLPFETAESEGTRRPVASGTYAAQGLVFAGDGRAPLTSDPFVVQKGEITKVILYPRPNLSLNAQVKHADTGEVIPFEMDFWIKIAVLDSTTEESLIQSTGFDGSGANYRGCTWQLSPTDADVKITLPGSPFWTFEEPLPLRLESSSTIAFRARPKD